MDLRRLADTMGKLERNSRGNYHLTLGKLIKSLESTNAEFLVECSDGRTPGQPNSYRGYYSDLAFEPKTEEITVRALLELCMETLDSTLEGYKGGDFVMDKKTPLWVSPWGEVSSMAVVDTYSSEGKLVLVVKNLDEEENNES